jgi:dTDP-4-dehydrorhamnose 3,5-epimerase-like enzyme
MVLRGFDSKNRHQLWVPAGFALGYYVLSEWAEFILKPPIITPGMGAWYAWNDRNRNRMARWWKAKPTLSEKRNCATLAEAKSFRLVVADKTFKE